MNDVWHPEGEVSGWHVETLIPQPKPTATLRDFYAMRAPRPWSWFKPVMPTPRPEPFAYKGAARTSEEIANQARAMADWDLEYIKQQDLQWPYFYADSMLAERGKP